MIFLTKNLYELEKMLILRLGNFINQIFYLMSKIFYFVGISVIALVLGLVGCSDDMPKVQQTDNDAASMKGKSALDMALERADEFFVRLERLHVHRAG